MNTTSKLVCGIALAILAAAGVHAETYDGVVKVTSTQSRAAVRAEGVMAAHGGDRFGDAAGQGVTTMTSSTDVFSLLSKLGRLPHRSE